MGRGMINRWSGSWFTKYSGNEDRQRYRAIRPIVELTMQNRIAWTVITGPRTLIIVDSIAVLKGIDS